MATYLPTNQPTIHPSIHPYPFIQGLDFDTLLLLYHVGACFVRNCTVFFVCLYNDLVVNMTLTVRGHVGGRP